MKKVYTYEVVFCMEQNDDKLKQLETQLEAKVKEFGTNVDITQLDEADDEDDEPDVDDSDDDDTEQPASDEENKD